MRSSPAATRGGSNINKRGAVAALVVAVAALAVLVVPVAIRSAAGGRYSFTTVGANARSGLLVVDGVGASRYTLLDWTRQFDWNSESYVFVRGAPQILMFDDQTEGSPWGGGHSSSDDPWSTDYGFVSDGDGTDVYGYVANTTTPDLKVSFSIDGSPYDLSQGCLFLIRTTDGVVEVQQVYAKFPVFFKSDDVHSAIGEFAEANDDVMEFMRETSEQQNRQ